MGKLYAASEVDELLKGRDQYVFNLDLWSGGRERWGRDMGVALLQREGGMGSELGEGVEGEGGGEGASDDVHFCLDACEEGNVSRFINHSCNPNVVAQCVFFDHHDTRIPHVMFFACEPIPAWTELAYDYGYKVDSVQDKDTGDFMRLKCLCGSRNCRKMLY